MKNKISGSGHLDYLDGWRGLAIVLLLWGHFFPVAGINLGTVGVQFFFVLSGLLMARLLFLKRVPLPQFYKRRIARIFPAFFFYLACVVLWYQFTGRETDWTEVLAAATFVNNYFVQSPEHTSMPLGHIWSLSVEEHSYILLSVLAILARRKLLRAHWGVLFCIVGMMLAGIAYCLLYEGRELHFYLIHSEFAAFGIFVSVLMLLYFADKSGPSINMLVFSILLMLGVLINWWSVPVLIRTLGSLTLLALTVNRLENGPPLAQQILAFYPLRQLGLWSYSIYLWQQPFYMAVHYEGLPATYGIVLGLLCGVASYYLIEQPARLFLNRRWDRHASVHPAAPSAGIAAATD